MLSSLKTKVIASFVLLLILPLILSGVLILYQVQSTEITQLNTIHTQMLKRVAVEFKNYVSFNIGQLQQMTELHDIDFQDSKQIKNKLTAQIIFNSNFDQLIFLNGDGLEIAHVHRYMIMPHDNHDDYSKKIEFLYPKLNKAMYFGKVQFIAETGEPVANISYDIRDHQTGALKGVMIAALRLKPIWNLLANINTLPGQSIYILDAESRVVAHPNPSTVLKNLTFKLPEKEIDTGLTGERSYIKYEKLPIGNQFFTIVSEHKIKNAYALLNTVLLVISCVVMITLISSILLITMYIKRIINPINDLASVAKTIEAGHLEMVAAVPNNDEIGSLAKAFNKMTSKLRDSNIQLREFNLGLQKKISTEIEKTRKMEQVLFEQKKFADMGQMINAIAHQWRQPLNNIGLIQQYLYDGFMNSTITKEEFEEYSESLIKIVQNMSTTIDDFRTFFATDKLHQKFNIVIALKDFIKLTSAQLNSNNIHYRIQCTACEHKHLYDIESMDKECNNRELEVYGHEGEFKQVLQNLVSNAKDEFIAKRVQDPILVIKVTTTKNSVKISFLDNAGGIPEEIISNIFDPYFTTKAEGKGTGIGLYISKVIIDEHFGGRLTAINKDNGAEFTITLPKARD